MTGPPYVLGPMERVLQLRLLPALESLPPRLLGAIAQHAEERFYAAGETIMDPNGAPDAVYVVVDGQVTIQHDGGRPRQVEAGGTVGFLEVLARTERGVAARAITNTLAIELGWDRQLEVCEQYFSVLHAYVSFLARQLVSTMKRSRNPFRVAQDDVDTAPARERSLDLIERMMVLRKADAFSAGSMDAIGELARHVDEVRFESAHTLWHRGNAAKEFVLITSGTVRCARKQNLWLAGPTVALGMQEVLAGRTRWYDAESVTPVTGLRIHIEPFLDMLEDHFELAVDVMARMAAQVIELSDQVPGTESEDGR